MNYSHSNAIIWAVLSIIFTFVLYLYGIRSDWQKLRYKKGLVIGNSINAPRFYDKYILGNKWYLGICIKLFFLTTVLSALIMGTFYYTTSTKEIKSPASLISVLLSLFFVYIIIMGAPLDAKEMFGNDKDKIYAKMLSGISYFKISGINIIINDEYGYLQKLIIKNIRTWYDVDCALKIGAFIMRINSDFFNEILPDSTDDSIKDEMKDLSYKLLTLYAKDDMTMLDQLEKLFKDKIFKNNAKIIDVANFINNLEVTSQNIKQSTIDKYIKEQTEYKIAKSGNKKTTEELNAIFSESLLEFDTEEHECSDKPLG